MNEEYNEGLKLVREACENAKNVGWTHELKEYFVLGCGMIDSAQYGVNTIIQHFIIGRDGWKDYSEGKKTWEQYINSEFEKMHSESEE
jgi:hypothetical protein